MATALTKFEVFITDDNRATAAYSAFLATMEGLADLYYYQVIKDSGGTQTSGLQIFGLLTGPNAITALAALVTLNTALGTPVPTIAYGVTTQP